MLKCKINGKDVEVKEGTLVIDAIKNAGFEIAHYCYHPGLSVAGVCRLCMVKIEGNPRLQIACNTVVQDGMEISNEDAEVKEAVKWGLDFHLINHPLDCPICDQAGECQLQIQYMKFGQYDPEMAEQKVKKRKVVDLGSKIVLDSERCILCSRCVRFTDEVSKTGELGIFNRGDRSEIGTFTDKPLENDYAMNTVDICPVGALTSKDFRFRQRVWYLKSQETTCTGCSTGCRVKTYYNEEGFFRVRPVHDEEVNGYWMCDKGRDIYKFVNKDVRLLTAKAVNSGAESEISAGAAAKQVGQKLSTVVSEGGADSIAVVFTGQYTNEEYKSSLEFFVNKLGIKQVYHWQDEAMKVDEFDGLLIRGDKNPNTLGLRNAFNQFSVNTNWSDLTSKLNAGSIKYLVVYGPENQAVYSDVVEKAQLFSKASHLVWLTACPVEGLASEHSIQIPLKAFVEKDGTFTNHAGQTRQLNRATTVVKGALNLTELATLFANDEILVDTSKTENARKTNYFVHHSGGFQ